MIFNGLSPTERAAAEGTLAGLTYTPLVPPQPTFDITAYGLVPGQVDADVYLFLNPYSRLLAPDWGSLYVNALSVPDVGLVGAGGSWASGRSWKNWPPKDVSLPAHKLARLYLHTLGLHLRARRDFPPAPWPWLRTNAFALTAATFASIQWPVCHTKWATWQAEMGRNCLSELVRRNGQRCVVLDRHGVTYEEDEWNESGVYANGDQANLC